MRGKTPAPGKHSTAAQSDLLCSSSLRDRRRRLGRKMLVQRAKSGDLHVSQHATWGMSDKHIKKELPGRDDDEYRRLYRVAMKEWIEAYGG